MNNQTGSDPDKMGAGRGGGEMGCGGGGIKCPILLPICDFPLGCKALRKDHTDIYCSFCLLLSSRMQTAALVCALRGAAAPFGRILALTGVLGLPSASLHSFSVLLKGLIQM